MVFVSRESTGNKLAYDIHLADLKVRQGERQERRQRQRHKAKHRQRHRDTERDKETETEMVFVSRELTGNKLAYDIHLADLGYHLGYALHHFLLAPPAHGTKEPAHHLAHGSNTCVVHWFTAWSLSH